MSDEFYSDQPHCHDNEIWDKVGYNSACITDISEMFVTLRLPGGFRVRAIE